jgi:hypothetical protein
MVEARRASCSQCSHSFELVPPADIDYDTPKEKATSQDYLKRTYECEVNHHLNTVFWQRHTPTLTPTPTPNPTSPAYEMMGTPPKGWPAGPRSRSLVSRWAKKLF